MLTRREALGSIAATPVALGALAARAEAAAPPSTSAVARAVAIASTLIAPANASPEEVARDEAFWTRVQQAFTVDRSIINLNNGGVSPSPAIVQEAMKRHLDFANTTPPPIALWRIQEPRKERVREGLARQWGVDPEEIAITRNSSESLQICQQGIDLKPGDEVLTTTQDYPRMVTTFKQRVRRDGLVYKQFKIPIPCEDFGAIVKLYEQNITPQTKLILMSHIIITGQIMPVKQVVAMARTKGIPVIVDGAHALAQFQFKISDLECDYYGVSLHKWLTAPHGTGLLYVRRDKIKNLWPLMASEEKQDDDIRKFEEIGTHPAANFLAIAEALTFHQSIGDANKEARLRYLRDYWAKRLLKYSDRVKLHTSLKPQFSCCISTVEVEGLDMAKLAGWMDTKRNILVTVRIKHDEFDGLRITPNVYTTLPELDRFCEAMEWAIDNGVPEPEPVT